MGHYNQLESYKDEVHLVLHGKALALGRKVAQAPPGLLERCVGAVSLVFDPRQVLAPVAIVIGALRRLMLPWMSALSDECTRNELESKCRETMVSGCKGPSVYGRNLGTCMRCSNVLPRQEDPHGSARCRDQ